MPGARKGRRAPSEGGRKASVQGCWRARRGPLNGGSEAVVVIRRSGNARRPQTADKIGFLRGWVVGKVEPHVLRAATVWSRDAQAETDGCCDSAVVA